MINTKKNTDTYYLLYTSYGESTLGTVANPALVVRANGNVGIDTSSPSYNLDVNGSIHGSGIYMGGYLYMYYDDAWRSTIDNNG